MTIPAELLTSELEHLLYTHTRDGWEIVNRTTTTAQLRRRKRWSMLGALLFILLPLAGGFLIDGCFYGVALGGFVLVLLAYLMGKDELKYITETDLVARITAKPNP